MKIDTKKLYPWNWFKHEDAEEGKHVPIHRQGMQAGGDTVPATMFDSPLWNVHREVDRLFSEMFSRFGMTGAFAATSRTAGLPLKPEVDIHESEKQYEIAVEIPGVEGDDVKLELVDGALVVSGEKKHRKEDKGEHYHTIERSYGAFRRVLSLPLDVDEDGIDAKFRNGVLTIIVPRKEVAETKGGKVISVDQAA